jgi:hypothetical protein
MFYKEPSRGYQCIKRKIWENFGYYFGLQPILVVTDPELLKLILVKDFHNFIDRYLYY